MLCVYDDSTPYKKNSAADVLPQRASGRGRVRRDQGGEPRKGKDVGERTAAAGESEHRHRARRQQDRPRAAITVWLGGEQRHRRVGRRGGRRDRHPGRGRHV